MSAAVPTTPAQTQRHLAATSTSAPFTSPQRRHGSMAAPSSARGSMAATPQRRTRSLAVPSFTPQQLAQQSVGCVVATCVGPAPAVGDVQAAAAAVTEAAGGQRSSWNCTAPSTPLGHRPQRQSSAPTPTVPGLSGQQIQVAHAVISTPVMISRAINANAQAPQACQSARMASPAYLYHGRPSQATQVGACGPKRASRVSAGVLEGTGCLSHRSTVSAPGGLTPNSARLSCPPVIVQAFPCSARSSLPSTYGLVSPPVSEQQDVDDTLRIETCAERPHVPEFKPPDFQSPLPIPESPDGVSPPPTEWNLHQTFEQWPTSESSGTLHPEASTVTLLESPDVETPQPTAQIAGQRFDQWPASSPGTAEDQDFHYWPSNHMCNSGDEMPCAEATPLTVLDSPEIVSPQPTALLAGQSFGAWPLEHVCKSGADEGVLSEKNDDDGMLSIRSPNCGAVSMHMQDGSLSFQTALDGMDTRIQDSPHSQCCGGNADELPQGNVLEESSIWPDETHLEPPEFDSQILNREPGDVSAIDEKLQFPPTHFGEWPSAGNCVGFIGSIRQGEFVGAAGNWTGKNPSRHNDDVDVAEHDTASELEGAGSCSRSSPYSQSSTEIGGDERQSACAECPVSLEAVPLEPVDCQSASSLLNGADSGASCQCSPESHSSADNVSNDNGYTAGYPFHSLEMSQLEMVSPWTPAWSCLDTPATKASPYQTQNASSTRFAQWPSAGLQHASQSSPKSRNVDDSVVFPCGNGSMLSGIGIEGLPPLNLTGLEGVEGEWPGASCPSSTCTYSSSEATPSCSPVGRRNSQGSVGPDASAAKLDTMDGKENASPVLALCEFSAGKLGRLPSATGKPSDGNPKGLVLLDGGSPARPLPSEQPSPCLSGHSAAPPRRPVAGGRAVVPRR